MKTIKFEDINNGHGATSGNALNKQTDADIETALKHSDAKLKTDYELSKFQRGKSQ